MPTSSTAWLTLLNTDGTSAGRTAIAIYTTHFDIFIFLGVVATILFVIGIVRLMLELNWWQSRTEKWRQVITNTDPQREQTKRSWKDIERHFFSGSDNDLKVAIMDADKSLDNAMRNAGIVGANLGDRLKKAKPSQLPNIEDIWQAHKLRNQIAHDDEMILKRDVAERALGVYKAALQALKALE